MKKFIIWLLILITYMFGVIGCALPSYYNVRLPYWLSCVLMFTNGLFIFYPALRHWEKYFKKLMGYDN